MKRFYCHSPLGPLPSQHSQMTALMEILVTETRCPVLQGEPTQQEDGGGDAHRSVLPAAHRLEDTPGCPPLPM